MTPVYEENTSIEFEVTFITPSGLPQVPESATYSLHNLTTGAPIITDQPIIPLSTSVIVNVTRADNAISDDKNKLEKRRLIIKWQYDSGNKGRDKQFDYNIKNLVAG